MSKNRKVTHRGWFIAGIITVVITILSPFIIMIVSSTGFSVSGIGRLGPVGDFFGGSTVGLLSIASIFFIIHTINIQSSELSLQREELSLSRRELEKTREEFNKQNDLMSRQIFDNTFFNLISNYNEIIKGMEISNYDREAGEETIYQNRRVFRFLKQILKSKIEPLAEDESVERGFFLTTLDLAVKNLISEFGYSIDHYIKNIYSIINLIDSNSQMTEISKNKYFNIFISMVSSDERYLLYCVFHSDSGEELKEMMTKYDPTLLSFMEVDELLRIYRIVED